LNPVLLTLICHQRFKSISIPRITQIPPYLIIIFFSFLKSKERPSPRGKRKRQQKTLSFADRVKIFQADQAALVTLFRV
jgi:hypothetical protein